MPDQHPHVLGRRPGSAWTACALLVALGAAARAVAAQGVAAPWIAPDEPTYGMLGRSLWETGRFLLLGAAAPFYGVVYPALAGLPLTLFAGETGVRALQVVQAVVMSATALVVFAWGRTFVPPRLALLAAALAAALPSLAYSGLIMTEAAYYPVGTLALLALARSLERPSLERQAVAVTAILCASLTRLQGLVLLPVLFTAVALAAVLERRARVVRRYGPTLTLIAGASVILLAFHVAGRSGEALGAYTTTADTSYRLGPTLTWTVWHVGVLFLLVGGVPLLATATLGAQGLLAGERDPRVRALLAVSLAYAAWSLLQVGAFSSRFTAVLEERYLLTVAPPLFLCFAVWLHRGAPRPPRAAAAALVVVLAPVAALPARRLSDPNLEPNAFTALAFLHLREWSSAGWVRAAWLAGAALVALAFALVPRRTVAALPAGVLALLVAASVLAHADVRRFSNDLRRQLVGDAPPDWIDRSARGRVAYVYAGSAYWNGVWLTAFWNRRIDRVVALPVPVVGSLPPHEGVSPRFDGRLFSAEAHEVDDPYVVAPAGLSFAGTPVRTVRTTTDLSGLTLWRVEPPLRMTTWITGLQPNGDVVGSARVDVFDCARGRLELTLLGKTDAPVRLLVDGLLRRTVFLPSGGARTVALPTPAYARGGTRCSFGIEAPLVGTTRIAFVRAD